MTSKHGLLNSIIWLKILIFFFTTISIIICDSSPTKHCHLEQYMRMMEQNSEDENPEHLISSGMAMPKSSQPLQFKKALKLDGMLQFRATASINYVFG